ncbi:hypothetical protein MPPM_3374 [Methylorubrum populi]|uniref:Uncharacterized protein n=1 Tax=Methylorubrum populi TaxID=223967 RepID=A0A160PFJ3_9HYPH|nr:hypothetical protein [Methylorubrum populi]BAU91979.1 hypothetical protein MPPM_3374 [Methylorubrum populi]
MIWARHPVGIALAVTTVTITGLALMLAEAAAWKVAGFTLAAIPPAAGLVAYLSHRRDR